MVRRPAQRDSSPHALDIDVNVSLSGLNAANITSGVFGSALIPTLDNSKISDLDAAKLSGTLSADRIASGSISDAKLSLGIQLYVSCHLVASEDAH